MGAWTSIDITAGPYSWHYEPAEKGSPVGGYGDVLDGLTVQTNYSEDHPLYGIPGPHTASFKILVADFKAVADLTIGAPVSIMVRNSTDPEYALGPGQPDHLARLPLVYWLGRISDLDAVPGTRLERPMLDPWDELGPAAPRPVVEVTVTCVDYLADLNEYTVGAGSWPAETLSARSARAWKEAKLTVEGTTWNGNVPAREAGSPVQLLEYANQLAQSSAATEWSMYVTPDPRIDNYDPADFVAVTLDPATDTFTPNPYGFEAGDYIRVRAIDLPIEATPGLFWGGIEGLFIEYIDEWTHIRFAVVAEADEDGFKLGDFSLVAHDFTTPGTEVQVSREIGARAVVYPELSSTGYTYARVDKRPWRGSVPGSGGWDVNGLPLVLELGDGGWVPVVSPLGPLDFVFPAEWCHLDTAWRKAKDGASINKITATNSDPEPESYSLRNKRPGGDVEWSIEALSVEDPVYYVWKYLPETEDLEAWSLEEVTILEVPDQVVVPWFNAYYQRYPADWARHAVVISGVVTETNPNGQPWVAGMFVNGSFTMTGGEWEMKIQLRPDVARSKVYSGSFPWYVTDGSGGTLLYGPGEDPYLAARGIAGTVLEGVTCAMFDPTVSAYDLRLVRRPD